MIISERKFRQIVRNELLKENIEIKHKWTQSPIDDHLGFCKIYADHRKFPQKVNTDGLGLDSRENKPEQPLPSRCFKIKIDLADKYTDFYNAVLEMIKGYQDIKMLDSCNEEKREICIELLCKKEECNIKLDSLKTQISKIAKKFKLL